jgi:hypothetical protein
LNSKLVKSLGEARAGGIWFLIELTYLGVITRGFLKEAKMIRNPKRFGS